MQETNLFGGRNVKILIVIILLAIVAGVLVYFDVFKINKEKKVTPLTAQEIRAQLDSLNSIGDSKVTVNEITKQLDSLSSKPSKTNTNTPSAQDIENQLNSLQ